MWNTFGRNGPENIWNLWGGTCEGENNSIGKSAPGRPREILLIQRGDVPSYSTPALGPSAGLLVNIRMLWYYFIRILQPAKIVNTLLLRNTKVDESGIRKYLCHLQNICFNHLSEYVIIICHKICTDYLQGVPKKITLQKFILGPVRTTHWDHLAPL